MKCNAIVPLIIWNLQNKQTNVRNWVWIERFLLIIKQPSSSVTIPSSLSVPELNHLNETKYVAHIRKWSKHTKIIPCECHLVHPWFTKQHQNMLFKMKSNLISFSFFVNNFTSLNSLITSIHPSRTQIFAHFEIQNTHKHTLEQQSTHASIQNTY